MNDVQLEDGGLDAVNINSESIDVDGVEVDVEEIDFDPLQLTRDAYDASTDYVSANLRKQWERNIANFRSVHPSGSKYHTPAYAKRSRLFRPKTRAAVRQNEAAVVQAFFSTQDVVVIEPEDANDEMSRVSADLMMEVVNYHLRHSVDWFQLVVGAFQDTMVYGHVIGQVGWDHEAKKPTISLIPAENFRIDPAADWVDPISMTPYIIHLQPRYAQDVRDEFPGVPESALFLSTGDQAGDSTRLEREGDRTDPLDDGYRSVRDHEVVWVYRNIFNVHGQDFEWYTLGTHHVLTDPVPISRRDYVFGKVIIETHRTYPAGLVELGQDTQAAINDTLNQRFDNVKLALNSRHFVRRNAQVDLRSLRQSIPGGLVMVGDTDRDVKPIPVKDVTASAYAEQDRFNADFDDVMGSFSQSSVGTARNLNETVGGMNLLRKTANIMTEYHVRVFAETFVEPMLRLLVDFIKENEDSESVLRMARDRVKWPDGIDERNIVVTRDMLQGSHFLSVNVGFGATDPVGQMRKLLMAFDGVAKLGPSVMARVDKKEIVKEVFGLAGYKNGQRFFDGIDDEQQEQAPPAEVQLKLKELELKEKDSVADYQVAVNKMMIERDVAYSKLNVDREIAYARMALDREIKLTDLYEKLGIKRGEIDLKEREHNLRILQEMSRREDIDLREKELNFKAATGRQGI